MSGLPSLLALPLLPVSPGEVLDRITILEVRQARLGSGGARTFSEDALLAARKAWADAAARSPSLDGPAAARLAEDLRAVNERLWNAEDRIRAHDRGSDWGVGFIQVAREICRLNDARADLKNQVDGLFGLKPQQKIYM